MIPLVTVLIGLPILTALVVALLPAAKQPSASDDWATARDRFRRHFVAAAILLGIEFAIAAALLVGMNLGAWPTLAEQIRDGYFGDPDAGTFAFAPAATATATGDSPLAIAQINRQRQIRDGMLGVSSRELRGAPRTRPTPPIANSLVAAEFVEVWLPMRLQYFVGVDGLSASLIALVALLAWLGIAVAWCRQSWPLRADPRRFLVLFLIGQSALVTVFAALDGMLLLLALGIAALSFALQVGRYGSAGLWWFLKSPVKGHLFGAMAVTCAILGGALVIGLILSMATFGTQRAFSTGTMNLVLLPNWLPALLSTDAQLQGAVMMITGGTVFLGAVPFIMWLPGTLRFSPTPTAMLIAGGVASIGAYLLVRLAIPLFTHAVPPLLPGISLIAGATVMVAAAMAWRQTDLKLLLGYAVMAHMGLVLFGFAAHSPTAISGATLHLISHGLFMALLIFIADGIFDRLGTTDFSGLGALRKKTPKLTVAATIGMLALLGAPGTAGFSSMSAILDGSTHVPASVAVGGTLALIGLIGLAILLVVRWRQIFLASRNWPLNAEFGDVAGIEWAVVIPLILAILALGFVPDGLRELQALPISLWVNS